MFYMFRLERIAVKTPRGRIPDNDIVTFIVLVNQIDRGHGTGFFPALAAGSSVPASAVRPNNRKNMDVAGWNIGPFELAPGDIVHVIYTGTNISDDQQTTISTQKRDELEIKLLSQILTDSVGSIGGIPGAVIGAIVGAIADPVKTLLGFNAQGPCNGPVFSDSVAFSGAGLDVLPMAPLPRPPSGDLDTPLPPPFPGISFTHNHTDEATHDKGKCGDIAKTDITFSVFRVPFISVRSLFSSRFPNVSPTRGLRQLGAAGGSVSLKSLLGVRP